VLRLKTFSHERMGNAPDPDPFAFFVELQPAIMALTWAS
jgi:hypothetical protein